MSLPTITLYASQTPNPIKISIALEELGVSYNVHKVDLVARTHKEPWYIAINPNGKVPAVTDILDEGKTINIWESGSILKYIVERYDKDYKLWYPPGTRENYELFNWLFFQTSCVGPYQGQLTHFNRHVPEKQPYPIARYLNETERLYTVLETQLQSKVSGYLVGDHLTIADIAHWSLVAAAGWAGIDLNKFPALKAWYERLLARPAFQRGMNVPEAHPVKALANDADKTKAFVEYSRKWVMEGMAKDWEAIAAWRV